MNIAEQYVDFERYRKLTNKTIERMLDKVDCYLDGHIFEPCCGNWQIVNCLANN